MESSFLEVDLPFFSFRLTENFDMEEIEQRRVEKESHKQRLLSEAFSIDTDSRTKENAAQMIAWIDPNIYHLLRARTGLDGEIILELDTADQLPQFNIEIEEHEAYVWIDFKTIPPIQFRIPLGDNAQ